MQRSLYERLGGYDAIIAFVGDLLPRLKDDAELGRFWRYRGDDGVAREAQLLIDYLCFKTGGPMYYTGRSMKLSHLGMNISEKDWSRFMGHAGDTMSTLGIPDAECAEIAAFVTGLKDDIVES